MSDDEDAEVKAGIVCTDEEWEAMGWEMRSWYRWLILAPVGGLGS